MAKRFPVAFRRIDFVVGATLLLMFAVTAGAAMIAPSTDQLARPRRVQQLEVAPLPLRLVQEKQPTPFASPPLLDSPISITFTPTAEQLRLERVLAEQRCLAEAMYYEARGEGVDGEKAIAEVVFHRVKAAGYPHSICGVVYQGAALKHACQFSFTCSGELQHPKTPGAWASAKRLAERIFNGLIQLEDVTEDAISFHAADVEPGWGDNLVRTIQIGNHVFYRAAPRSTQAS